MIAYALFALSVVMALGGYYIRPLRHVLAVSSMVVMGFSVGLLFSEDSGLWGLIALIATSFQLMNVARLVDGRLHAKYLKNAFFIGGGRLFAVQLVALVFQYFDITLPLPSLFDTILQLLVALGVFGLVLFHLRGTSPKHVKHFYSDHELPSISVLLPARNEDRNLEEVLHSVVASDYPKLEILVLDDCSVGKHIPEIVKEFAHDGVRFVQGEMPKPHWLAKNQAYETLADQASGDWLVFMGVDVRLGIGSLKALVHYAENHNVSMISVLPRRTNTPFLSGFFSPLRYFREFIKPGVLGMSVPALSTVWIIKKDAYLSLGGIESVARKVIPEHYFAKRLKKMKKYAFVRTNDYLQVATSKGLKEQIDTSIRVIYPSLHRQIEQVFLSSGAMFVFLFLPFVQLIIAVSNGVMVEAVLYGIIVALLTASHLVIVSLTNPILWPLAVVNFPYLVVQEIILGIISMCKYEFGEVDWKGRNVCLPVMHVVPRLPALPPEHQN